MGSCFFSSYLGSRRRASSLDCGVAPVRRGAFRFPGRNTEQTREHQLTGGIRGGVGQLARREVPVGHLHHQRGALHFWITGIRYSPLVL